MSTEQEIIDRSRELLAGKPSFADDNSQFMTELSTVLGVGVHKSAYESHSDRNEFYSETAQLDSSLLAKASDEGRIPNRPLPQVVTCSIKADGYQEFTEDSVFISDLGTKYLIDGTIIIDGETVYATFRQEDKKDYSYMPTAEEWQEFIVGSNETTRFFVYVNGNLWENFEDLGELESEANGYVTRYNIYDQLYVRTGNGFLGKIPDSQINIVSYDTKSLDIQVGASLYAENISQNVEIQVTAIIQNSQPQESARSVAKSLPFWRLQSGSNGYASDYINDIKGEFPEVLVINVWGEKKASQDYNRDNINIIFVSVLRENNQSTLGSEVIDFLASKKNVMQVDFEWREPILISSSIAITGEVERSKIISSSESAINTAITKYYGLYAAKEDRKNKIYRSNVDEIIKSTGVFDNLLPGKARNNEPDFEYTITGSQTPSNPREIIYIPLENIAISIAQVDNT